MNTEGDLTDLSLNDTEELISSSIQNPDINKSSRIHEKQQHRCKDDRFGDNDSYSNIFEASETLSKNILSYFSSNSRTCNENEISPPKFASTYRQSRPQTAKQYLRNNTKPQQSMKVRPKSALTTKSALKTKHAADLDNTKELINMNAQSTANMSVWENWLLEKVQMEREVQKKEKEKKRLDKAEKQRIQQENEEKKKRAKEHHKEWCEQQELKIRMQRHADVRKKKLEKELQQSAQARKETRSEQEFLKWMEKKKAEDHEKAVKTKVMKKKQEEEKAEREKKNKVKFEEWLQKIKTRPKSPVKPNQGIITNYPEPAFKNPAPWVGPLSDRIQPREEQQNKQKRRPTTSSRNPKPKTHLFDPQSGVYNP